MVKTPATERLLLLLAASNFDELELNEILEFIKDTPVRAIASKINALCQHAVADAPTSVPDAPKLLSTTPYDDSNDISTRIEQLLVLEAGLTKSAAAFALQKWLKQRHPKQSVPTYQPKDGFVRWVRQLSKQFTLSELLHAASSIRNRKAHGQTDDWLESS